MPAHAAAREPLRAQILDAMRELLFERDWSKITLGDVASHAGVSRQTLYNEFGSRLGLAEGYALRLADDLVAHVSTAITENAGDARAAFRAGITGYFLHAAADPLIRSLLMGEVKLDLLRIITLDAAPLLDRVTERLTDEIANSWIEPTRHQADVLAHAIARIGLSYIPTPPSGRNAPEEFAELLGPYVEAILAAKPEG
ncbi:TetR family transcriptional regulator [Nocardia callitridis]|uniref:TetR family transcriptional regulator n=2 Tax=Nocardia callitridis TaxID=648753 RepID=A0ABP9JSV9_9NOCA